MLGKGSLQITLKSAHLLLPHHAVASSKGKCAGMGRRGGEVRTRRLYMALAGPPPATQAFPGGVWSIMIALWRSPVPGGDGFIAQPQMGSAPSRCERAPLLTHAPPSPLSVFCKQASGPVRSPRSEPSANQRQQSQGKASQQRTRIVTPDRPHTVLLIPNSCPDPPNQSFGLLADEEHVS